MMNKQLAFVKSGLGLALCFLMVGAGVTPPIHASNANVSISQQAKKVTGTVTDAKGEPLLGVNVVVKGTTNGTITDLDGKYSLEVEPNSILVVSYIGYVSQQIPASGEVVNVTLKEDTQNLDEVVVVGYGTQQKKDITGSVAVVDTKDLLASSGSSATQQLQGKAAGVYIGQTGSPGSPSMVRIRGINTVNDNGPLYVIDGVSTRNQDLSTLNPNDIESMQVLKDTLLPAYSFTRREGPVSVSPDRMTYDTRSGGEIRINGLPPDLQTLSVSIAGIDLYKPSARSGIVDWKQSMPTTGSSPADRKFLAEYEGPILTGKVIDLSTGEPSSKEAVRPLLGFSGGEIRLFGGQLGPAGEVTFFTRHISGTHEIVTVALSPSSSRYRVDIESPYAMHPEKELPALRLNPAWQDELVKRSVGLQVLHAYRSDSLVREKAEKPWFQWQPDWSYLLDEYTRFTTMEEVVIEFIPGLRFRKMDGVRRLAVLTEERIGYTIGNSLVLLDGIPIVDHEIIFKYDPLKIRKIDVYKGKYVFGGQIFDGIASFSSYEHNYPGLVVDNSTQFFDYEGTQAQRIFYMPAYRTEAEKRSPVPDFRHTLLWRPDIRTNGESSISIPFTTSDLTGDFTITIEGLTQTGEALYATEQFQVK